MREHGVGKWVLIAVVLVGMAAAAGAAARTATVAPPALSHRPELAYLEAVNRRGPPPDDPQLLFLLASEYLNANRSGEGSRFFTARLDEFGARLSPAQRGLYLAAIGLLRARHAREVSLFSRLGWVKDTVRMLDEAKRLTGGDVFVVRWIAGIVASELPSLFGQRQAAARDSAWCAANARAAPHPGWLREVHRTLAALARDDGDEARARLHMTASGYSTLEQPIKLNTAFSESVQTGHTFSERAVRELVPGVVYAASGYDFSELYFVVSADRRQLVAVDAGTRDDSARDAYEALRARLPDLPPLTTVLVTHAHWDHVGGHGFFRHLSPRPTFYASAEAPKQLAQQRHAPQKALRRFFGERFSDDDVQRFRADVGIERETELTLGGTRIALVPTRGGESEDALLVRLLDHDVTFVGDIAMPYLGAPQLEEGDLDGLLASIEQLERLPPQRLLHGHDPLTRLFPSTRVLSGLKPHLAWLRDAVLTAIERGSERAALQQSNLIPPGLLGGDPTLHLPYLVLRENVIDRLYDRHSGYWQPDLSGMDVVSDADRGALLFGYLGVSEHQLVSAAEAMVGDGRHELAMSALKWARAYLGPRASLATAERLGASKLMERNQATNPFKFILYAHQAGTEVPQLPVSPAAGEHGNATGR